MGISSSWPKTAASGQAAQKTRAASTRPMPALIHQRLSRWPRLRSRAWMAALERPKSRKISPTPMIASTIASRP